MASTTTGLAATASCGSAPSSTWSRPCRTRSPDPRDDVGRGAREPDEHPLQPLARHRTARAALRPPGADPEHPAPGRPGRPLPGGLLRVSDLLGQPRVALDRAVLPQQRDARTRAPRLVAERLRAASGPSAAGGG